MNIDQVVLKQQAAEKAVEFVESGMIVGLGHGSTAIWAVRRIGELLRTGIVRDILGVPVSPEIEREALALYIPLTTLDRNPAIDLTIDGADEITPDLNVIKGGGGQLLREKIVAQASRREIIVADASKFSDRLGTRFAVPVEVIPFGWQAQAAYLESLGASAKLRTLPGGEAYYTPQDNLILDCRFSPIADPSALGAAIKARTGIVEHGLFIGLVTDAILAGADGIRHLKR